MHDKAMSGSQLEQALMDGKLAAGAATMTGMVKKSEKLGHVAFTRAGCDTWVDIPVEMIESAEHIGHQTCKDHTHPLVRVTLKTSDNPKEQILIALLAQQPPCTSLPSSRLDLSGISTGFQGNPGMTFDHGMTRLGGGGLGGFGGGPISTVVSRTIGCTECKPNNPLDVRYNVGSQICVHLVCTTIGHFHYCQLVTEVRFCGQSPWDVFF